MNEYGYVAACTLQGHCAAVLELRCDTPELAQSQDFIALAQALCHLVAQSAPQYLSPEQIPQDVRQQMEGQCRHTALSRGIPDNILDDYCANLYAQAEKKLCLLSLPLAFPKLSKSSPPTSSSSKEMYESQLFFESTIQPLAKNLDQESCQPSALSGDHLAAGLILKYFSCSYGEARISRFYRLSLDD